MRQELTQAYVNFFLAGQKFSTIIEARRFAESVLGQSVTSGTALTKQIDESIEAAIVRVARTLVQSSHTTHEAYDRLTDLLERQPNLSVRSSTSVLQQAYSTPIPIAYLASVLANIIPETTVYEPTAGNGALLIASNPEQVIANEINGDRFSELVTRGYSKLTQEDATVYQPQEQVDRVLCNPPFGSVLDENRRTQRFRISDTWTTQIDQVIALKALEVMKNNGRAVLILGGKLGNDAAIRSDRYNTRESRAFFYILYNQYNVTQHFSIWGDLYRKQGAGFPIDVIVIEGRGKSQRLLPAASVPVIYRSFSELKEILLDEPLRELSTSLDTPHDALAISGQSAKSDRYTRRANLQDIDAGTSRLDDSALDRGDGRQPDRHADSSSHQIERNRSLAGLPVAGQGSDRPSGMAGGLGRNADSSQPSLHRGAELARSEVSAGSHEQESSRVSGLPVTASSRLPGGMAQRSDQLGDFCQTKYRSIRIKASGV